LYAQIIHLPASPSATLEMQAFQDYCKHNVNLAEHGTQEHNTKQLLLPQSQRQVIYDILSKINLLQNRVLHLSDKIFLRTATSLPLGVN